MVLTTARDCKVLALVTGHLVARYVRSLVRLILLACSIHKLAPSLSSLPHWTVTEIHEYVFTL